MMRHLIYLGLLQAAAGTAHADITPQEADCVLFEHANRQGAAWTSQATGKDPFSPNLTSWWQDRASSVWVRPGFVLEAYLEPGFKGRRVDLSADVPGAVLTENGSSINLDGVEVNDQLSSYRCRPAGETRALERDSVLWMEGARYSWLSGGNHPNHKDLEMITLGSDLIVRVHADHTYGSNRQDFEVNLGSSKVRAKFSVAGYAEGEAEFDLTLASARPDFKIMLEEVIENIQTVAEGYTGYPPVVEPPKPELQSLVRYLQTFIR
jgi:hypothetical protein